MNIFKIVGFGIISVSLIIILKNQKPEMALMCVVAASIIMLLFIVDELTSVIELLNRLIENSSIDINFLKIILKVVGISYIVEFGKNICIDAGESSIANKVDLGGKIIVISLSIPVISATLTSLVSLLN